MKIVGIDVGLDGGIAVLRCGNDAPLHVQVQVMPTLGTKKRVVDANALCDIFRPHVGTSTTVFFERVHAMPARMASATGKMFASSGLLEGILVALHLPYQIISAVTWQKAMLAGLPGDDTKVKSIIVARRLFSCVDLRATERCTKAHDGMADALLIAEYGRRLLNGK